MKKPDEVIYNLLKSKQIAYETIIHRPDQTEAQVMDENGLALHQGAKSMVLKADDAFLLVVLAGDRRLDLKKAKQLFYRKKVRLATNEEIRGLMGCGIGSCYPIGSVIGLETYVDTSFADNAEIFFNPGVADRWIQMRWKDYEGLVKPDLISVAGDK